MSKKQAFIDYVRPMFADETVTPEEALDFWKALIAEKSAEKPKFTDNGKLILRFLQEHQDTEAWKSKDIAGEIGISSKGVAGSMRKLVNDEYVEKVGSDPVFYTLTQKGKEIDLDIE